MAAGKRPAPAEPDGTSKKRRTHQPTYIASARLTRSMTTAAARNAVFNTSELLENILVHLPFKKLFVIQRVSEHFREIITTSVQIQQKMWLRSRGKNEYWRLQRKSHQKARAPADSDWEFVAVPAWGNGELYEPHKNPTTTATKMMSIRDLERFVHPPKASWKAMLLTDPPVDNAKIWTMALVLRSPQRHLVTAFAKTTYGRTLGTLVDAVLSTPLTKGYIFKGMPSPVFERELDSDDGTLHQLWRELDEGHDNRDLKTWRFDVDIVVPTTAFPTAAERAEVRARE